MKVVDDGDETTGRGGDVYAEVGVDLSIVSSNFTGSSADYAGAGVWCCGASITNCYFTNLETSLSTVSKRTIINPGRVLTCLLLP